MNLTFEFADFEIGDEVIVTKDTISFSGQVKNIDDRYVIVTDGLGQDWHCEVSEVEAI